MYVDFFFIVLLLGISDQHCSYVIFVKISQSSYFVTVLICLFVVYLQKNIKMVCSVKGLALQHVETMLKQ